MQDTLGIMVSSHKTYRTFAYVLECGNSSAQRAVAYVKSIH